MNAGKRVQGRMIESWAHYQDELVGAIAPLTEAQLAMRPVPQLRSVGEVAEHIVRARALWLPPAGGALGEALARLANWDEPDDPPRSGPEIVHGLQQTWGWLASFLERWRADDSQADLPAEEVEQLRTIWGLMEHDLHHGGELAFALGALGLDAPVP